jgi:predicted dehydrogenase
MELSTLRIGFVGAGENTRKRHLPGFRAQPRIAFTLVANRTLASAERVAREFGIGKAVPTWRQVVESPEVDAVCIGTWPYLHAEVTVAALRAGKHVLTEARMARTVAEAEAMVAESARHPGLVTQIVPAPMSLAYDQVIIDTLQSGALGELREVCVTQTGGQYCDARAPLSWRQDAALSGYNVLALGIYYEMVLRWLGEDASVVAADEATFTRMRPGESGIPHPVQLPDSITVLGRYATGARLVLHCSGVEGGGARNEVRLNGSAGSLKIDVANGELILAPLGEPARRLVTPAVADGGWNVEAEFVASIRDGAPVRRTSFAMGLATMRFTEAARLAGLASAATFRA